MNYDYSKNILVQESAGNILKYALGLDVVFVYNLDVLGKDGTLGRLSYKEILLTSYFRNALKKLNSWITQTQKTLEEYLSTSSLLQINEKNYFLIRDGIPVTVKKSNRKTKEKKAIVIDLATIK